MKDRIKLDLQLFSEEMDMPQMETGVEDVPDAEVHESGEESSVAAEPNNFEKAFAKRLAAKEAEWRASQEAEINKVKEQYKDFDIYRKATEFLQKQNGINDVMTLKEQLELVELQERAERHNVDPEVQRRIEELEAKAARADELEQQRAQEEQERQQQQQRQEFERNYFDQLGEFAKAHEIEGEALNKFMIDNGLFVNPEQMQRSFEIAFKAMQYDQMQKQLAEAEKNGMKKLIQSKSNIPTVPGKTQQGQVVSSPPKTWAEARQRAMQRGNGE